MGFIISFYKSVESLKIFNNKSLFSAERLWFTLVILTTWEAYIRRTAVQSHPRKIVHKTLSPKNLSQKWDGGVAQGVDP
jgi:hypothetical protein